MDPLPHAAPPGIPSIRDWIPIRSLSPADRPAMVEHLLQLDEHDRYLRFGHTVSEPQMRDYVERIDFGEGEVLGIFNRRLELLGMSHLADLGHGEAEFGVSVVPKARGRGFGQLLFEHACQHARVRGLKVLVIHALAENAAMMVIASRAGAQILRSSGEATARVSLPPMDLSGRWWSRVDDQAAELDFQLKASRLRVQDLLEAFERPTEPRTMGNDHPDLR